MQAKVNDERRAMKDKSPLQKFVTGIWRITGEKKVL